MNLEAGSVDGVLRIRTQGRRRCRMEGTDESTELWWPLSAHWKKSTSLDFL